MTDYTHDEVEVPSLDRSRKLATIALIVAIVCWIILMVLAKIFPDYVWLIHILMLVLPNPWDGLSKRISSRQQSFKIV